MSATASASSVVCIIPPVVSAFLDEVFAINPAVEPLRDPFGDALVANYITTRRQLGSRNSITVIEAAAAEAIVGTLFTTAHGSLCAAIRDVVGAWAAQPSAGVGGLPGLSTFAASATGAGGALAAGDSTTGKVSSRSGMTFLRDKDRREWETGKKTAFAERLEMSQHLLRVLSDVRRIELLTRDIDFDMSRINYVFDRVEMGLSDTTEKRAEWKSVRQIGLVREFRAVTDQAKFQNFWLFRIDWQRPANLSIVDFHDPTSQFDFTPRRYSQSAKKLISEALKNLCSMILVYWGVECDRAITPLVNVLEDGPRMDGVHDVFVFCKVNKALAMVAHDLRFAEPSPTETFVGEDHFVDRLAEAFDAVSKVIPEQGYTPDYARFYGAEYVKVLEWPGTKKAVSVTPPSVAETTSEPSTKSTTKKRKAGDKRKEQLAAGRAAIEAAKSPRSSPQSIPSAVKREQETRKPAVLEVAAAPCPYYLANLLKVAGGRDGEEFLSCRFQTQGSCNLGRHVPLNHFTRNHVLTSLAVSLKGNLTIGSRVHSAVSGAPKGTFKDE